MPSPCSSKEGAKQIVKVSVSYHTHGKELSLGTGTAASHQRRLQLAQFASFTSNQMKHQAVQSMARPLLSLPQSPSVGRFASVSETQSWAGALGKSFLHSIQMASGCSLQGPPFTHPAHLLRWAHPPQPDRLLCRLVLLLLSNVSDVETTHRGKAGSCAERAATARVLSCARRACRLTQEHQTQQGCLPGLESWLCNYQRTSSPRQRQTQGRRQTPQEGGTAWLGYPHRAPAKGLRP